MALLAEVAARAGVPVEGVVRVVTRQPVSRRIEQRVVDVLDSLEPDQLRALERLARAGLPEVLPERAVSPPGTQPSRPSNDDRVPASQGADELALQLGALLEEVAAALNELRRVQLGDRQDRVDDLAVLVDLMTTGWRGVDRRLARLERSLARLEPPQETPARLIVATPERSVPQEAAPPPPPPDPQLEVAEAPPRRAARPLWRRWLAPVTPVLFVAGLALALLAFELFASPTDGPRLVSTAALPSPPRSLSSTTGGVPKPAPPPALVLSPARTLAWPGQPGAGYYLIRIRRGQELVYEARPKTAHVVLPQSLDLTPGTYRWSVRAGIGAPARAQLGVTIVESRLIVTG